MENQKAWPNENPNGQNMKGKGIQSAGAPDEAPLLGESNLATRSLGRARNDRVAMHEVLRVFRTANSPSRTGDNHWLAVFGSLDFQTCPIADYPKSAGREAALGVGLETCAAAVTRRDLAHNLSLSLVASCHR
jgi:hypothetical protein